MYDLKRNFLLEQHEVVYFHYDQDKLFDPKVKLKEYYFLTKDNQLVDLLNLYQMYMF